MMGQDLHVSWESDVSNGAVGTEGLTKSVLVNLEGDVTDEEGVGLWVLGVTVLLGTLGGTLTWSGVVTRSGEVNVGLTTVDESTLLGLESLGGVGGVGELNVTETLGAASGLVADDTSTGDLTELLKLAVQPLVINVPAQVTNEQVLGTSVLASSWSLGLGLLGSWLLIIISLTLLRWSLLTGLRVGVRVGVGRVLLRLLSSIGVR
jgi:hypothetical protein